MNLILKNLFFLTLTSCLTYQEIRSCYDSEAGKRYRQKFFASSRMNKFNFEGNEISSDFDLRERYILSPVKNQHLPVWCGSCWAFAAASTITDRFYIQKNEKYFNLFYISVQEIISCSGGGTCAYGGIAAYVYEYAIKNPLSDETCDSYTAIDRDCSTFSKCSTCYNNHKCVAIQNYEKYYLKGSGAIRDIMEMMYQIHEFGPISCSMFASRAFLFNYTGGIYLEESNEEANHEISLIGWGSGLDKDGNELPYWIGRNSWGTFWGEKGFFRIPRKSYMDGKFSHRIEDSCTYPII